MNSANTYKSIIHQRKPYIVSTCLAVLFALGISTLGVEEGYRQMEEAQEAQLAETNETTTCVDANIPFKDVFQRYAHDIHWEWQLLAAVAYHESRFNPYTVSHRGARGLMQLMPSTGARHGLTSSNWSDPDANVHASVKTFASLQHLFQYVTDSTEQACFVLAAYNAGQAHVIDARNLTKKYGGNPNRWKDVDKYLLLLNDPQYYTDPVVKYGRFGGKHTSSYVKEVFQTAHYLKTIGKPEPGYKPKHYSPQNINLSAEPDSVAVTIDTTSVPAEIEPAEPVVVPEQEATTTHENAHE